MSGKRWLSAIKPSAASDRVRGGARPAAISLDLLQIATRCSSACSTGLVDRLRLPARGETPRSGSSAHAGLHRRGEPAWTGTGLPVPLLDRAGVDPRDLLRAQRGQLVPIAAALASEMRTATGYDYALALWRHESVSATLRFLDALLATVSAQ